MINKKIENWLHVISVETFNTLIQIFLKLPTISFVPKNRENISDFEASRKELSEGESFE